METVVRQRQDDYYRVLAEADKQADATPFVEFMLKALLDAIVQTTATDQVTDQVARVIEALARGELGSAPPMKALDLTHKPTFRENYLDPAMKGGWIERTQPDSPRSPTQRYRLTEKGRRWMAASMTRERR